MAYSTSNPPRLIAQGFAGGPGLWQYASTDAIATVAGSSYFSNGDDLGMKKYDMVHVINTSSTLATMAYVKTVTSGAGVTIRTILTTT